MLEKMVKFYHCPDRYKINVQAINQGYSCYEALLTNLLHPDVQSVYNVI